MSNYKCKCEDCSTHGGGEEGLPIWMQTFADMMTLLFAFFVLLYSMSSPDPVKYAAFANSQATQTGGSTNQEMLNEPLKDQSEIKQELEELIEKMDMQDKAKVTQDPRGVALELDGDVCFGSGSVNLKDELKATLDNASVELMSNASDLRSILIEGHTDNVSLTGKLKEKYTNNRTLSSIRASQVVNYLVDFLEVNENRLVAEGYADQWPAKVTWSEWRNRNVNIDKYNSTENEKKKNRRIKIIFTTQ